jgi:hypothetical protein
MELRRNKLFLFDLCCFIGYALYIIVSLIIHKINNLYFASFIVTLLFAGYIFFKSICGLIFLPNAIKKKEININKNVLYFVFDIIYIILLINILDTLRFRLTDSDINYNITILGLTISTFQLYILAIINMFINIFGIPMWQYLFLFQRKYK